MKSGIVLVLVLSAFSILGYLWWGALSSSASQPSAPANGSPLRTIQLAAVGNDGSGVLIPLTVELRYGSGKILINIDNPTFISDTQDSMRLAVREASRYSGQDLSRMDVIFSLNTNASIIGGASAGAGMTVAVIATATGKTVRDDVVITGTITEGGGIGRVGGILAKAQAARGAGKRVLLVPQGEGVAQQQVQQCVNQTRGNVYEQRCTISYKTVKVSDVAGITVLEVRSIAEAAAYLLE
jgi:predicted S18 family serine protease